MEKVIKKRKVDITELLKKTKGLTANDLRKRFEDKGIYALISEEDVSVCSDNIPRVRIAIQHKMTDTTWFHDLIDYPVGNNDWTISSDEPMRIIFSDNRGNVPKELFYEKVYFE